MWSVKSNGYLKINEKEYINEWMKDIDDVDEHNISNENFQQHINKQKTNPNNKNSP